MDLDFARAQRRRDFEPDEARAEYDDPPRCLGAFDDRAAILERTEHEQIGRPGAGQGRGHGLSAGRKKQAIEPNPVAACERDFVRADVDRGRGRIEAKVDRVVGIELGVA
jgi:hypothetical protein